MQILIPAKKKADVVILISDKVDFKARSLIRDTGSHIRKLKNQSTKKMQQF